MDPAILANVRTALAALYSSETDIRRVATDTGIDLARISFGSTPQNIWYSILAEARKTNKVDALLLVAQGEYPNDQQLLAACDRYRSAAGGASGSTPGNAAVQVDPTTFSELVALLTPQMTDESQRRALVQLAVGHSPVANQIQYSGPAHTFTVHLVQTLQQFGDIAPGQSALGALLKVCREQVGVDRQKTFDAYIARV